MSDTEDSVRSPERLRAAIQEAIHQYGDHDSADRGIVIDFALAVEMMGDDGKKSLQLISPFDSSSWRTMGLLAAVLELKRHGFLNAPPMGDEEDV